MNDHVYRKITLEILKHYTLESKCIKAEDDIIVNKKQRFNEKTEEDY